MTPIISDPKDRFSALSLGAGRKDNRTEYRCPTCATITPFTEKAFVNSLFKEDSVLTSAQIERINLARVFNRDNWEEFFDFECRGCQKAVRVIFIPNEYRMGCHYYQLKDVIELD